MFQRLTLRYLTPLLMETESHFKKHILISFEYADNRHYVKKSTKRRCAQGSVN